MVIVIDYFNLYNLQHYFWIQFLLLIYRRPETGNIKPQITNLDVQYLTRLKEHYSKLVTEKEEKLHKLKEELTDEWDQLRTYQNQIREAQKRNTLICKSIDKDIKENIITISKAYSKSDLT